MGAESKRNRHVKAHFSFGNEETVKMSSYQTDFSSFQLHTHRRRGKPKPPMAAEILPHVDKTSEKHKWVSSTMRDFVNFGDHARTRAYQTSRAGFMQTKSIHNQNRELLRDNVAPDRAGMSNYVKDFRNQCICTPTVPEYISLTRAALRRVVDKREMNISEARHAFQWPTSDRLKEPLHFRKTGLSTSTSHT